MTKKKEIIKSTEENETKETINPNIVSELIGDLKDGRKAQVVTRLEPTQTKQTEESSDLEKQMMDWTNCTDVEAVIREELQSRAIEKKKRMMDWSKGCNINTSDWNKAIDEKRAKYIAKLSDWDLEMEERKEDPTLLARKLEIYETYTKWAEQDIKDGFPPVAQEVIVEYMAQKKKQKADKDTLTKIQEKFNKAITDKIVDENPSITDPGLKITLPKLQEGIKTKSNLLDNTQRGKAVDCNRVKTDNTSTHLLPITRALRSGVYGVLGSYAASSNKLIHTKLQSLLMVTPIPKTSGTSMVGYDSIYYNLLIWSLKALTDLGKDIAGELNELNLMETSIASEIKCDALILITDTIFKFQEMMEFFKMFELIDNMDVDIMCKDLAYIDDLMASIDKEKSPTLVDAIIVDLFTCIKKYIDKATTKDKLANLAKLDKTGTTALTITNAMNTIQEYINYITKQYTPLLGFVNFEITDVSFGTDKNEE